MWAEWGGGGGGGVQLTAHDVYAPALAAAFPNPELARIYGTLFERGCRRVVVEAVRRRGGGLCSDPSALILKRDLLYCQKRPTIL